MIDLRCELPNNPCDSNIVQYANQSVVTICHRYAELDDDKPADFAHIIVECHLFLPNCLNVSFHLKLLLEATKVFFS